MRTIKSPVFKPIFVIMFFVLIVNVLFLVKNPGDNFYFPQLYSDDLVAKFGPEVVEYGSYDATFYAKSAEQLLEKGILGYASDEPNAYVTPGQPIYLAVIFSIADLFNIKHSLFSKIINMILNVTTVYIIYLIGKELFSRRIGLFACLLYGFYFPVLHYFRTLLTETPAMFFFYLSVYFVIKAIKENNTKSHLLFGILFSISIMIRPNQAPLVLLPIFLVLKRYGIRKSIRIGLYWLVGPLLVISPWVIRNAIQFNEFILFSTQSNPLLAGSNPFFLEDYNLIYQNMLNSGMKESEYALMRIKEGFTTNPILWICWIIFGKTFYLFNQPSGWYNYLTNYSGFSFFVKSYHFAILALGTIVPFFSKNKNVRLLMYSIIIYVAFSNIFLPNDRYGFFIYPVFILISGFGVCKIFGKFYKKGNLSIVKEEKDMVEKNEVMKNGIDKSNRDFALFQYLIDIYLQRHVILELAKKDFKSRYLGSYLGVFWAFIQPSLLVVIYWFVFQVGFRSTPVENYPFVLWLLAGIVPWFYFSDSLASATSSIEQNGYLVKKVVFNVHFLPIVKIASSLMVHIVFLVLMFIVFFTNGETIHVAHFQVLYYSFSLTLFLTGLSWIVSSLNVFLKDIGQIVTVVLQFGFWLTPIFWTFNLVPERLQWLFKINPIYYIVEGYRDALINHGWFWENGILTLYFWGLTITMLFAGAKLFKKISPHFSDVL